MFAFKHNLNRIISKPTRITETLSTTIDLIFINNSHRIVQCDVLTSNISDHCPVFCVIKGGVKKLPHRKFEYRSFKTYSKHELLNDLKNVSRNIIEDVDDNDDSVFRSEKLFKEVADQHAPIKSKRAKGNRSPWVTEKLSDIRRDRDYHLKKAH